ncbi:MAG: c-type cytochrome biogenesis protein CcmI [Blastocatellia bacterium]|nr:c-type cytochrome biogenesis protein CcmI [Blastocatellia bacterium]
MILFWVICAVMVAIALAFVLPPLLATENVKPVDESKESNVGVYRDQLAELKADLRNGIIAEDQYQQDRDGIERRMLEDVSASGDTAAKPALASSDRRPAYAVAFAIPLIAIGLYLQVGNPRLSPQGRPEPPPESPSAESSQPDSQMTQPNIQANVAALAKRLEQNPNDVQGWTMLGRSYTSMEKYQEASDAYAKATALKPDDADLWADYAFATAMANGQHLQGKPQKLIAKSLQLDPNNAKGLELAGSAAFETKNYKQAIDYWQRLLAKTPAGSELAQTIAQRIDQAKKLAESGAK